MSCPKLDRPGAAGAAVCASPLTVTVIIPVYNAQTYLAACLERIRKTSEPPLECIVIDDGSTDTSAQIARGAGCQVVSTGGRRGPAFARNLGARAARGDILLFLDADVLVRPDTVARILKAFTREPSLDAVIGSYDDEPAAQDFLSQYRNLSHCFIHQTSREQASTFWTGCGAIRRELFVQHGGFREAYRKPCIEDVELGFRLRRAGCRIRLDKGLQVKHMKHWSLREMLKIDVLDRAIPWTLLILRFRSMPADLNLRWEHRLSVFLLLFLATAAAVSAVRIVPLPLGIWLVTGAAAAVAALNLRFYRFLAARRGLWFALGGIPLHFLQFLYSGMSFVIGLALHLVRERGPLE